MYFFASTPCAFVTFAAYLVPMVVIWISAFYLHRYKEPVSGLRRAGLMVMTVAYVAVVYNGTFGRYFFGVEFSGTDTVTLIYLYPERRRAVDTYSIGEIRSEAAYKGNYQMVIRLKNGERIDGAPSSRVDVEDKVRQTKTQTGV